MKDEYVEVELDKPRRLRLDLNAMSDFEKATGKNFSAIGKEPSATDIRALLWACLKHEDERMTPHDIGKLITPGNMGEIIKRLVELYKVSLPEPEGEAHSTSPLA
ncbi:MAG: hypothetical protein A2Y91_03510 [Chloroflexi bacterium RBG_13_54_8]|nr:MAG: hypothetical protein A2Y91_03510 [Chloroflexi bacterium RBG_13_54_8]